MSGVGACLEGESWLHAVGAGQGYPLVGEWGNLFLGKDFIYSTKEYVSWDQAAGFCGLALCVC